MKNVFRYYVRLCLFLLPISFLPIVTDPYGFGKLWLIVATGGIGWLLWLVSLFFSRKPSIKISKFFWWLTVLLLWSGLMWWRMSTGGRMRSLMMPNGAGLLIGVWLWSWLWMQVGSSEERQKQFIWLTVGTLVTAVISMIVFMIPSGKMPISWPKENPWIIISQGWSLAGGWVAELMVMTMVLLGWVRRLLGRLRSGDYLLEGAVIFVLLLVLLLDIFRLVRVGWTVLDLNSAWIIAVEVFKREPLWGVGWGNFVQAFNMYRPISYNLTDYWASGFLSSTNGFLNWWTESGLVGLLLLGWLVLQLVTKTKGFRLFSMVLMVMMLGLLPVSMVAVWLAVWLIQDRFVSKEIEIKDNFEHKERFVFLASLVVIDLVLLVVGGYWWTRIMLADSSIMKSYVAAAKNDGGSTYNWQIKAIANNPYNADYRRMYSQTNMALTKSILETSELSDDDKQKSSVLVQQAVREAKTAISLDSLNVGYWMNLAGIYKQIIGVVDGSADWAFQSYQQAALLDPVNPTIGMELGGLLYASGRYEEADRVFEQVVLGKPDHANAWYNWAHTAKNINKLPEAVARLSQTLSLIQVDSGDYEMADKELMDWKKQLDAQTSKQQPVSPAPTPELLKTADPLPVSPEEGTVKVTPAELLPPRE